VRAPHQGSHDVLIAPADTASVSRVERAAASIHAAAKFANANRLTQTMG
jgi:hypothetical protein